MFILWYSASSTFGKDSDIVMGVRAQQKEKTRRSLVEEKGGGHRDGRKSATKRKNPPFAGGSRI